MDKPKDKALKDFIKTHALLDNYFGWNQISDEDKLASCTDIVASIVARFGEEREQAYLSGLQYLIDRVREDMGIGEHGQTKR